MVTRGIEIWARGAAPTELTMLSRSIGNGCGKERPRSGSVLSVDDESTGLCVGVEDRLMTCRDLSRGDLAVDLRILKLPFLDLAPYGHT